MQHDGDVASPGEVHRVYLVQKFSCQTGCSKQTNSSKRTPRKFGAPVPQVAPDGEPSDHKPSGLFTKNKRVISKSRSIGILWPCKVIKN